MAAAHENLPHLQLWNYMVSNVDAGDEGWDWVDVLDEVCVPPTPEGTYYPGKPVPNVVHYCQTFRAGDVGFMKRRVPHDLFTCEHAMLITPPTDLGRSEYRIKEGEVSNKVHLYTLYYSISLNLIRVFSFQKQKQNQRSAKRNAFVLCIVYDAINSALMHYKEKMCKGNPATNYEKTVNINNL